MSAIAAGGESHIPSAAFGDDFRRFWNLVWTLAVTDFKLRFFGSALGYLWTLVRPLMLFGVLYFVFTEVVDIGGGVKYYPIYLLTGIVLYGYFSETTSTGLESLVARENLLRKMRFPRLVIPLSAALTAFFNLGTSLLAVLVYMIGAGVEVRWSWLQLPFLVLILTVLGVGLAMLLSALYVRYRDISPIWDVALQLLFYASPILYVLSTVPDKYERAMLMNPIAAVLTQMRHAVLDPDGPVGRPRHRPRLAAADSARRGGRHVRHRVLVLPARGPPGRGEPLMATRDRESIDHRDAEERHLEEIARAHEALSAAQDRAYWLDRWGVDLNVVMRAPGADWVRRALRGIRMVWRKLAEAQRASKGARTKLQRAVRPEPIPAAAPKLSVFKRSISPDPLRSSAITDLFFDRLGEDDIAAVEATATDDERRLLDTCDPATRRRLVVSLGVHHGWPACSSGTALTPAMPPEDVHSMSRGAAAAGGSLYYADMVVDGFAAGGFEPAAGTAMPRLRLLVRPRGPRPRGGVPDGASGTAAIRSRGRSSGLGRTSPASSSSRAPSSRRCRTRTNRFDASYAISIWSHFYAPAAERWLPEMRRILTARRRSAHDHPRPPDRSPTIIARVGAPRSSCARYARGALRTRALVQRRSSARPATTA